MVTPLCKKEGSFLGTNDIPGEKSGVCVRYALQLSNNACDCGERYWRYLLVGPDPVQYYSFKNFRTCSAPFLPVIFMK